ncbi:uncharacterized protein LOC132726722 isoform X2 [Ruditapes philippinarum]|uniref:uncharacterized protein LOC132726722 isoform X2 n=1 Tax=Ruditapes philippinarum TaxID=129788 RepID=UPI00295A5DA4|nr:uncharacterized protein LOC132726722 isoform X2 [Ruditapes philippinarum]
MQRQIVILLCVVFLCVVDSRNTEIKRRSFLQVYRELAPVSLEVTTEEPTTTEGYPSSPDNEVPDVDIPEIDYENWPYAMMEFTSLIGRCITSRAVAQMMPNRPKNKFLTESCPLILQALESESKESVKDKIKEFGEENFGVLQCANLLAERENVESVLKMSSLSKKTRHFRPPELRAESSPKCEWSIEEMSNVLFEEAKDLYELCERTLADAIQSPEELQKGTKPEKRFFAYWSLASMLGMFLLG